MIDPIKRDVSLYKNATFQMQFRITDDDVTDAETWTYYFKAVDKNAGGDEVLAANNTDSPAGITIDETKNKLITIEFDASATNAITQKGQLYFEVDAVTSGGERQRRWIGNINLIEAA